MKRFLLLAAMLPQVLWSQYHFDFEGGLDPPAGTDPDWSMEQIPAERWVTDSVNPILGNFSLKHSFDNPGPGCDYFIIHHDPFVDGDSLTLSFRIRHGYNPSSSNNWQVALLAEYIGNDEGSGKINEGIIVGVNLQKADDLVKIWMAKDGELQELCVSSFNYQESVGTEVASLFSVSWKKEEMLILSHRYDSPGSLITQIGSCLPGKLPEGRSLVIRYKYSTAQDRKLWLDEICLNGQFVADTIPPAITGLEIAGESGIILQFSETIAMPSAASYSLCVVDGSGSREEKGCLVPDSLIPEKRTLQLLFPEPLPNRKPLILAVNGLCDTEGNCLQDTLLPVMRNEPVWGDVVINEVMYDPEPRAGEFLEEYVELFNRSDYPIQLEGWVLSVGKRDYEIGDSAIAITPGGYFLLSGVALPNQGAPLALHDRGGILVHAAIYQVPFEGPEWKIAGGWSLETLDPELVCNTSELWQFSTDSRGGTPGEINSVDTRLEDLDPPLFLYHGFGDNGSMYVQFSEPVHLIEKSSSQLVIHPGTVYPDSVVRNTPSGDRFTCYFPPGSLVRHMFRLVFPDVSDCVGNLSGSMEIETGAVASPEYGAVVINEVMYDPEEGSPEYIELFNPSSRSLDLQDLALDIVDQGAVPERLTFLWDHSRILGPGKYVAVTRDVRYLRAAYGLEKAGSWVGVEELKSLPGGGGWIYLTDRSGNTLDLVEFSDQMHMEEIDYTRGISLERIAWDRPGHDPGNWHSAASIDGHATPGKSNSQTEPELFSLELLAVDPKVFSPDNDGYNDLLGISLGSMEQGSVIRLWITDMMGNPVKELANNHNAGPAAIYTWNGEDESGSMVKEGIYVIHLKGAHPLSGRVWNRKCAAGVVYR